MYPPNLYQRATAHGPVRVGLIGTGHYGTAVVTQSPRIPLLHIAAVADRNLDAARRAFELAGITDVVVCATRDEAVRALPKQRVIVEDAMLLMDLPLDVIAEATGHPEAGARHASEAIRHGKHVAMISKEPDSVVGPILKHLADQAGVVYTQVDGDQHGLLIGWVAWLRNIGLEIVSAGKARDNELVFAEDRSAVWIASDPNNPARRELTSISFKNRACWGPIPADNIPFFVEARREVAVAIPGGCAALFDYCETVIAANATGLAPDRPDFHQPVVRITEIPGVLSPLADGGILKKSGVIDLVTCLRGPHEAGLGGGVFAVVACENDYSRRILTSKGLIANARQTTAVVYRPHHLCGVETPTSILCAGLLGAATGNGADYRPRFDMIVATTRAMKAGDLLDCEHDHSLRASLVPAVCVSQPGPMPAHLGTGRKLKRDIPAGHTITRDDVDIPADSFLLNLRIQQDALFANKAP